MATTIDLHNERSDPDYTQLHKAGIGMIHKASEGQHDHDSKCHARIATARRHKVRVGFYHFARPDLHPGVSGAQAEARNFISAIQAAGGLHPGDFKPVLDMETPAHGQNLVQWSRAFDHVIYERFGVYPIFYSYTSFIVDTMKPDKPIGSALWLANYASPDKGNWRRVLTPKPWKRTHLHQYTANGTVPGYHGDVSKTTSVFGILPLVYKPVRALVPFV